MISVKNLAYSYPTTQALHNINFQIQPQTITAMVGPNGSGKTTLLECLAGLRTPQQGEIIVNNLNTIEYPREAHEFMGFLPDFFGLYDELTVKQSMYYFAMAQKLPQNQIESACKESIQDLGLLDKWESKVSELSRGMRQRLAIGQVLLHKPKVLLLDEPASGLDPEARHALAELFLKLNAQGMTIVVSSHILSELDQYANNLLIIREGEIVDTQKSSDTISFKNYMLQLQNIEENTLSEIESIQELTIFEHNQLKIQIAFDTEKASANQILKKLIEKNIPVQEFFEVKNTLENKYLQTIKQSDHV